MFGLLNINKPRGLSSYDVIRRIKRLLDRGEKIGHAGTLDPAAEGVLVVCLGPATRLADCVQQYEKEYVTLAHVGATSTTDDAEGETVARTDVQAPELSRIQNVLEKFVGEIDQTPPAHSAVHVDGKRAYQLARAGEDVPLKPRPVTIYSIQVLEYEFPNLRLHVRCASGTYIRSLVRDLGQELQTGAYCQEILRTQIGPFRLEQSLRLEGLDRPALEAGLLAPALAVPEELHVVLPPDSIKPLAMGQAVKCSGLTDFQRQQQELAAVDEQGHLLALVRPAGELLWPAKVFIPR